jgi:hypothetical protein
MNVDGVQAIPSDQFLMHAVTKARWYAAEDKIYPIVMVDPGLYESVIVAVSALSRTALSQCHTEADLFALDHGALIAGADTTDRHTIDDAANRGVPLAAMCDAALAQALRMMRRA